jgi:hypothetical protein
VFGIAGEQGEPGKRVAWVTGASRGVSKGIASALGVPSSWTSPVLSPPEGVGRAISAPADDPGRLTLAGRALSVDELAVRYRIDVTS